MVLRLGQKGGGKTDFAIVRVPDEGPECFFLEDERVFELVEAESFVPDGSIRSLLPFHLLNQLKERSATSLAYATGVLERALDLDEAIASPVTDSGVYAFEFVPHPGLSPLVHNKGQIEVDGLFLARRGGGECVFVVEAKVDSKMRSVSKHKLAYPIYGMQEKVPAGIPIIPVYLRILRRSGQLMFFVAECEPFSTEPLTTLKVKRASAFNLILPALSIN
jgi:hypothetical protein